MVIRINGKLWHTKRCRRCDEFFRSRVIGSIICPRCDKGKSKDLTWKINIKQE